MSSDFESDRHETDIEHLPTPGAMRWGHCWMPTLDGERIPVHDSFGFESRAEAWAEAIKWVKRRAGLAMEIAIGGRAGCLVRGDIPVIVETVTEAREAIAGHAKGELGDYTHAPEKHEHVRLRTRRGRSAWKSLAECEISRRYDPAEHDAGMTCSYLLYEEGGLGVVGGGVWTYSVEMWATGPPEVWDHPADQPVGLDNDDDPDNDGGPASRPAELPRGREG